SLRRRAVAKRALWWGLERPLLRGARVVIPQSAKERETLVALGLDNVGPTIPIAPEPVESGRASAPAPRWPALGGSRYVLFLGRVHPVKGLLPLAQAWGRVGDARQGARLVIAGPVEDTAHRDAVLRALAGHEETVVW